MGTTDLQRLIAILEKWKERMRDSSPWQLGITSNMLMATPPFIPTLINRRKYLLLFGLQKVSILAAQLATMRGQGGILEDLNSMLSIKNVTKHKLVRIHNACYNQ